MTLVEEGAPAKAWDSALISAIDEARTRWSSPPLPEPLVRRYVEERLSAGSTLAFVPELVLACALARGDEAAVRVFERDYLGLAGLAIRRRFAGTGDPEDALQSLREKLLVGTADRPPLIVTYAGTGPLGAWLTIVADRHALRVLMSAGRSLPPFQDAVAVGLAMDRDPELAYLRSRYHEPFRRSLAAAVASLDPHQRTVLKLRLIDGLTPEQIADLYRVHRTTIVRRLVDARDHLQRATRRCLMQELSLSFAELSSVLRLMGSELPAVLGSHLRAQVG
jgi:RNA polymerase sigma-70 factor (ECF subfamily)